jgi:hypothetical protein
MALKMSTVVFLIIMLCGLVSDNHLQDYMISQSRRPRLITLGTVCGLELLMRNVLTTFATADLINVMVTKLMYLVLSESELAMKNCKK